MTSHDVLHVFSGSLEHTYMAIHQAVDLKWESLSIPNFAGHGSVLTIDNRGFTILFTTLRNIYIVGSLVGFKKTVVWPGTEIIREVTWLIYPHSQTFIGRIRLY